MTPVAVGVVAVLAIGYWLWKTLSDRPDFGRGYTEGLSMLEFDDNFVASLANTQSVVNGNALALQGLVALLIDKRFITADEYETYRLRSISQNDQDVAAGRT